MANLERTKSPVRRIAAYKANFRMTSKGGVYYERRIPPMYAKFFIFNDHDKVINRPGFTDARILAEIGGEPTSTYAPAAHQLAPHRNVKKKPRDTGNLYRVGRFVTKALIPPISAERQQWYNTEKNTAALIQSVVKSRTPDKLSGDEIWSLITLTWITVGKKHVSPTHWKRLKIPALESLFSKKAAVNSDLSATIDSMNLPSTVAQFAKRDTGMVNFRGTWRNSSRKWCQQNRDDLRNIISAASKLPANDQVRINLADRIDKLPRVESPNRKAKVAAGILLTPLIACLDPRSRFPIINGREAVNSLLRKLRLDHNNLADRAKGLIGILAQKDAFMLDVMSEHVDQARTAPEKCGQEHNATKGSRVAITKLR